MADPFEYDVFISFSSADEKIVKPIWQELCSNGLRVFWSDSTLKKEVGNSWFDVIEKSLERSRHMLLVCSDNSMNSKWVQREYRAFFDYCYSPSSRRLIPLLTHEFSPKSLPLFLRELQVGKVSDSNFIQEIIPILGGINIEKLQQELKSLQEQVNMLLIENRNLSKNEKIETNKVDELIEENKLLKTQLVEMKHQNSSLNKTMKEREKTLLSESASLKEQIIKLDNENKLLVKKVSGGLLNSEIKGKNFGAKPEEIKKEVAPPKEAVAKPKGATVTLPDEGALSRFIKIANQQILNEPAEKYLEYGLNFLKKSDFDDAILEFVKVFRKSSPQEKAYKTAKEQLRKMGFTNQDMDFE